ncbi:STAS domain-containing protein [Vibrio sonorensis]|uniref:STAS domain-containing protein n=1 Tax=Vibrio sonorensis TaxID=1004316 RepID=UPI0008D94D31|nr:STAS domain-containing protein [Vibrio sonorensis]
MECTLSETLDISTVLDASTLYQQWLSHNEALTVDASQVSRVDAAGIQVLTSLFLTAKRNQINAELHNPSPTLVDGIEVLGLCPVFNLKTDSGEIGDD